MPKPYLTLLFLLALSSLIQELSAQSSVYRDWEASPRLAVKSTAFSLAAHSVHLGLEFGVSDRLTFTLAARNAPWNYSEHVKHRHVAIQPELRLWNCSSFNGLFFGLHGHYAYFNMYGFEVPFFTKRLKDERWQGELYGAGLSIGYQKLLSTRLSIEGSLGAGYAYLDYDIFDCIGCRQALGQNHKNYLGPTKTSLSLVYVIN